MIIIGDIASPTVQHSAILKHFFEDNKEVFTKNVICNLEGLISEEHSVNEKTPLLFNHPSVVEALTAGNVNVCALANNHTLDIPEYFDATIDRLEKQQLKVLGAGSQKNKIQPELVIYEEEQKIILFNYCWDFLLYHQQNPTDGVYVSVLEEEKLLNRIKAIKGEEAEVKIVVYFHWSFDLEILPFPSYRKFAKELIDSGVNVVVGCHSHCIQGGELYKEGAIVYGLGNFFIPWNTYVNGEMTYPDFSKQELGLEWDLKTNQFYLHWFEIQGKDLATELLYQGKTTLDDDKFLKYAQPYKLSDQEYLTFFKKNRRKKVFIPVFTEYKGMKYSINMSLLKTRARVARSLAKYKLRKWNN